MKRITAALLFLLTIPGLAAPKPVTFELIDIPGVFAIARGINDAGDIVGELYNDQGGFGFIKRGDRVTLLSVPGALSTRASGIDNAGRVAGWFYEYPFGYLEGFVYENGQYTTLERGIDTWATGISEGKVVGTYSDGVHAHGFLYVNGQFTDLNVPGAANTLVYGINRAGKIVGRTDDKGFSYLNGQYEEIDFPRIGGRTELYAVNSDSIVGGVSGTCAFDPFILTHGKFSLLGLPVDSHVTGINESGMIVGEFNGGSFIAQASKFIVRQ